MLGVFSDTLSTSIPLAKLGFRNLNFERFQRAGRPSSRRMDYQSVRIGPSRASVNAARRGTGWSRMLLGHAPRRAASWHAAVTTPSEWLRPSADLTEFIGRKNKRVIKAFCRNVATSGNQVDRETIHPLEATWSQSSTCPPKFREEPKTRSYDSDRLCRRPFNR